MVRKKSDRFKLLQRLASKKEEQAAGVLGKSKTNLVSQQSRLEELHQFRVDYHSQLQKNGQSGMTGSTMQMYRRFIGQLDQAITQQQGTVVAAEGDCAQKKHQWQQTHTTTQIYDKTVERAVGHEQHEEQRKEQRAQDEHAQRTSPGKDTD